MTTNDHIDEAPPTFRLAAYAVCVQNDRVLLVQAIGRDGHWVWTLPGGRVEPLEDPFQAVSREFGEETGCGCTVERLLGVDSRVIPAAEAHGGVPHQNVGIFYQVRSTHGHLRHEPNGDTTSPTWVAIGEVEHLKRSGLIDVGLALLSQRPLTGHVDPVRVSGLVQH